MEIYFKTSHRAETQEVTSQVTAVATQKLNSLKKYLGNRKGVAKVYVELGKDSEAHQNGSIWRAQINLDCDGKRYHADSTGEHLEPTLATAIRELEQELRKAKQLHSTKIRKGGGLLKSFMRGFQTY